MIMSRNKEKTLAIIEAKKAKAIEEARLRRMAEATRLLRPANARFRDARNTTNVELARRLREEGESRLAELGLVDPAAGRGGNGCTPCATPSTLCPRTAARRSTKRTGSPGPERATPNSSSPRVRGVSARRTRTTSPARAPGSGAWEMVQGMAQLQPRDCPRG